MRFKFREERSQNFLMKNKAIKEWAERVTLSKTFLLKKEVGPCAVGDDVPTFVGRFIDEVVGG